MRLFLLVAMAAVIALAGLFTVLLSADTMLTMEADPTNTHAAGNTTVYKVAAPQTFDVEQYTVKIPHKIAEGDGRVEQDLHLQSPIQSAEAAVRDEIEVKQWSFRDGSFYATAFDSDGDIFGIGSYKVSKIDTDDNRQTTWTMPEEWYASNYDGFAHEAEFYFHSHGNLSKFDPETGVFTTWDIALNNNPSLVDGDLYFGRSHFVAELSNYTFLAKFNPDNGTLTYFANDMSGYPYTRLHHGDSSGLYFAVYFDDETQDGIMKFVPDDGTVTYWSGIPNIDEFTISGEKVYWEYSERNTANIVQLDMETRIVTELVVPSTCNSINDMVADSSGNIFFTCYHEFYKFIPSAETFTKFYTNSRISNLEIDSSDTIYWNNGWFRAGTISFVPPEPPIPSIYWSGGDIFETTDGIRAYMNYYVEFDKYVTGFEDDDIDNITVSGTAGAVLNTTNSFASGSDADFEIYVPNNGTIVVTIPENIVMDERGVGNVRGTHTDTISLTPPEVISATLDAIRSTITITTSQALVNEGDYDAWSVSDGNTIYDVSDYDIDADYRSKIIILEFDDPVPDEVAAIYVTHSRDVYDGDPQDVELAQDLLGQELVIENICIDARTAGDESACQADGELN